MIPHLPRVLSRLVLALASLGPCAAGQSTCSPALDLWPGPASSNPAELTWVKGLDRVFFAADHPAHGRELWVSDGSAAGTSVLDIGPGPADPSHLRAVGQGLARYWGTTLFFVARRSGRVHVWSSDGTLAGTRPVATVDGPVRELVDGGTPGVWWWQSVYFTVDRSAAGGGWELWRWTRDVRDPTTEALTLLQTSAHEIGHLTSAGGQVWFRVLTASGEAELWRTFLTATRRFGTFAEISELHPEHPYLYFSADDGSSGHELWQIHLSDPAPHLVEDLAPGSASSAPYAITRLGRSLYYAATTADVGTELRRLPIQRGTAGSAVVHDVVPGPGSSNPVEIVPAPFRRLFGGDAGSLLYFTTASAARGEELWVTEMDTGTTRRLAAVARGKDAAVQYGSGEFVVFSNRTAAEGLELWSTDGTAPGTRLMCDLMPGAADGAPDSFAQVGCELLFAADDPAAGRELHRLSWGAAGVEPPVISKYGLGGIGTGARRAQIFATHVPRPGTTFGLTLSTAAPDAPAVLLLGIGCRQPPLVVGPGCSYYLGLGGFVGSVVTTNSNGTVTTYINSITGRLPTGTSFTAQFAVLDPLGCFASLIGFSDAMRVVLGR